MQILMLMIAFLSASQSFAKGGMDSGGGDNLDINAGAAWFLGSRPVKYCIDMSPTFGMTIDQARKDIESAARTWSNYITDKKILGGDEQIREGYSLALNYQFSSVCDDQVDLTFYLGVNNSKTDLEKSFFENPTAFVHRESYDDAAGWGKGFVWVSPPDGVYPGAHFPNWTLPQRFHGTILHEIGHILGNGHVPGTIMDADLTPVMQFSGADLDPRAQAVLTQIDDIKEMILCMDCAFDFHGVLGYDNLIPEAQTFKQLTGRDPVGKISAEFRFTATDEEMNRFDLIVTDSLGTQTIQIAELDRGTEFVLANDLFKMIRRTSATEISGSSTGQEGRTILARATIQGKARLVEIERNASDENTPMIIYWVGNGPRTRLFAAVLKDAF